MTERPPGASPVDAITAGTRLREWDVVGFRGRGSYGVVFEARRSSWLDEPARALKVFDPIVSRAARRSLLAEFSALTSVRHPHLLAGLDAFDLDEPPFAGCVVFVLELADEDLGHRIAHHGPRVASSVVAAIGAQVAEGLAALHDQGRVHGDVKPENILRVGERWVLGDFGLTGLLSGSYAFTAGTTVDYRPPELVDAPEGARLHRGADVWALGVTLHVAATGHHPFRGPDPMMRYASVVRGDRTPVPDGLDPALTQVVDVGCLTPDPRRRLAAAAVAARLRAVSGSGIGPGAGRGPGSRRGIGLESDLRPGVRAEPERTRSAWWTTRWFWIVTAASGSVAVAQAIALGAGALDADLAVRRGVYVAASLGALAGMADAVRRRMRSQPLALAWRRHLPWTVGAVLAAWVAATLSLFGVVG